ncbi:hypothetical protein L1987_20182 [Smallanthus sonchifolius]|uniref:Uncharacterized protein n=1 Tax=Smallanthus sonchifolius TaxID=185202 RepID=A0ACB9IQR2_9ASTR|nr:hypothetical protein L1987_20182 [Smallanthus sonchifolius]
MVLRVVLGEEVVAIVSAYAPHVGLGDQERRDFWGSLDGVMRSLPRQEKICLGGDFNGHVGKESDGFPMVHGGFGYGVRNDNGRELLDFALAHDLGIINTFFIKRESHLITFSSGGRNTQIDYFLMRQGDRNWWKDCKVIPGESVATQHRLLVADFTLRKRVAERRRKNKPRIRWGNLKDENINLFKDKVMAMNTNTKDGDTNQMWVAMATTVTQAAKETLGVTLGATRGHQESWWWNEEVRSKIKDKQQRFKEMLQCSNGEEIMTLRENYRQAKREAKKAVSEAKNFAYETMYRKLDTKEGEHHMFKIAKNRERRRQDLGVVKFIKEDDGRVLTKSSHNGESHYSIQSTK